MKLQRWQTVLLIFSWIQLSIQIKKHKDENSIESNLLKKDKNSQLSDTLLEKESENEGMQIGKGGMKSESEGERIRGRKTRGQVRRAKTWKRYKKSSTNR